MGTKQRALCCISQNQINMFGLFKKDPVKEWQKQYRELMEEAMHIQRSGDLRAYAAKIEEAEAVAKKIEEAAAGKKE
ncbi:MAG TPA: DUF6435 family protein [Saprospiraceae bacterium]|jgi:hypothetical protein|nr:DUF6435 family protein [Saprospiraceae bacterium]HRF42134.1 DUF6435 family protein [Saprospiraceae bacterium]HRJ17158.1 DUF6435 family protein [Saprospiraceae bacterium]HRK83014.1 DUF6435 family protein [Saprospiraceae bacterium]